MPTANVSTLASTAIIFGEVFRRPAMACGLFALHMAIIAYNGRQQPSPVARFAGAGATSLTTRQPGPQDALMLIGPGSTMLHGADAASSRSGDRS